MQLAKDAKRAIRLGKRVLKGRRAYFSVRQLMQQRGELPADHFRIGVYFADSDVNIYQMRQWYAPLRKLSEQWPVLVLARNAAGASALMRESGLDVEFVQRVTDLERTVASQRLDVVLYVNQNTRNFQMMRYGRRFHVFVNHGESDKMYMTSNQHKAYDFAYVAGDAARERLSRALWEYDVEARTIPIGRPQADHLVGEPPFTPDERTVVLYAPTWEGDRPAASYGSIASHGETLVRQLLATGRHRVVYRPHPRSGVVDSDFGAANARIVAMLEEANREDPRAQHVYDTSPAINWQLSLPDVAICDISAMVYDRLATGKPLMVTRPTSPEAVVDEGGYLSVCEWLDAGETLDIAAVLDRVIGDDTARERLVTWSQHYFGDTSPGAPTRRFHAAIADLLARADLHRSNEARRAGEPRQAGEPLQEAEPLD
ncbi:CDP-glycerol glycerophosphotransferase family protein [Leucobacter sp. USHLN153]|uniref:CDP-glycerol glycerophosphotransferase family protein n=1 Tax=Leucobacter sp. USHLN153 TaxID=3081268 RepID=UPI0030160716